MLALMGTGAAATVLASCGIGGSGSTTAKKGSIGGTSGTALAAPPELRSSGGLLEVVLTAAATMVPWGDGERYALTFNGTVPGPTLRVRPGDLLRVTLKNDLDETTNLHTHGLHVSPDGNSDNVSLMIEPGRALTYEYQLPANHPSGTFWYHPHHHGYVASQVFGGLAGVIIVDDAIDDLPEMQSTTERILVLSDPRIGTTADVLVASTADKQQGREGDVVLVSGALEPRIAAVSGSVERWRIVNASSSRYYRLSVDAPNMYLIGSDQGRLRSPQQVTDILLTPGQRAEVLVPLPNAGTVTLSTTAVDRGSMSMGGGMGGMGGMGRSRSSSNTDTRTTLLTVDVSRSSNTVAPVLPPILRGTMPASGGATDSRRSISFGAMSMGTGEFVIDGKSFDEHRIDTSAKLGTTEEWTITNNSMMDHPFHLHVWPFQVLSRSNGAAPDPGWRDTVNIPTGQSVTILVPFEDYSGTTVYHCHILDHEDLGMMATINVS